MGFFVSRLNYFFQEKPWIGPDLKHSDLEQRFLALGKDAAGKHMIVAFTFRVVTETGRRLIRPISARYMHQKEVLKYEQAFAKDEYR